MILTDYDRELINGIVQRIDFLRAEQELTMYQLALRANMSENSLKFIYKKQSYPNINSLYKICEALGISMSDFFLFEHGGARFTKTELELLRNYEALTPEAKMLLLELSKHLT